MQIANSRVNNIIERLQKRDEAGVSDDEYQFSSMLELIIDMVKKNPNCLTENEIIDHLITFVGTVCRVNKGHTFQEYKLVSFFRVKIHNLPRLHSPLCC